MQAACSSRCGPEESTEPCLAGRIVLAGTTVQSIVFVAAIVVVVDI